MARQLWTHDELLLVMNLYCRLPFGQFDQRNSQVQQLAGWIRRTPSSVAMKLSNLASLDPVHQSRGVKGMSGASNLDRQIWAEFHADWSRMAAESEALWRTTAEQHQSPVTSDHDALDNDAAPKFEGATDTTRIVAVRLAQSFFRRTVLASYERRCCITDIALPQLLIASHIVPWSSHAEQRTNPRNGLCLSRLHDAAFDRGLITFDEDCRLVLSKPLKEAVTNAVLTASFARYEGERARLPTKFAPDAALLRHHREYVFCG